MRVIVMGVSGSGKSTIGAALADAMDAVFIDADDLHPKSNIVHMKQGLALNDDMRWPWLDACGAAMLEQGHVVLACSCLKRSYRDHLRAHVPDMQLVYPHLSRSVIKARLAVREGHFMPPSLLSSQFSTLEEPTEDEAHLRIDGDRTVQDVVAQAVAALGGV